MFKKDLLASFYNSSKYENILEDPNSKLWNVLDYFILFLILLFPFILIFESIGNNSITYFKEIFIIDAFISIVFAFEYLYRFFSSSDKKSFLYHPIRIIDLLSFLPFFLWFISSGSYLKILRIIRILRVFRVLKKIPLTSAFFKALNDYKDEYFAVFTIYSVVLFIGSFFVYYAEKNVLCTDFTSVWQALRWGIVTTATVWYGDIFPITVLWKIFWSILVFLWPILWWLISAVTIMVFMETYNIEQEQKVNRRSKSCPRCNSKNPKIANYCLSCWKKLLIDIEKKD